MTMSSPMSSFMKHICNNVLMYANGYKFISWAIYVCDYMDISNYMLFVQIYRLYSNKNNGSKGFSFGCLVYLI